MNEESVPKPAGPQKPVIVPQGAKARDSAGNARLVTVIPAPGASPPAPGSIIRSLLATRGWAGIDAFAFIIFGCVTAVHTAQRWIRLQETLTKLNVDSAATEVILVRLEMLFSFAFAAGCLFAALKLFRYSGAIMRLRQASRMHELEKVLRHQRTVWMVLGTVGALWLVLFTSQLIYLIVGLNEIDGENDDVLDNIPQERR